MAALHLNAPDSWQALSQPQLDYLFKAIATVSASNINRRFNSSDDYSYQTSAQVAVMCLFDWNDIGVVTRNRDTWLLSHAGKYIYVAHGDITGASLMLSWVGEAPSEPVRLECIDGAVAVDATLDDSFSFDDWLACETLWQGYQNSKQDDLLRQMAEILYHKEGICLKDYQLLSIFYWWTAIKTYCNRLYQNFFQPVATTGDNQIDADSLRRNMDAQIRALTKGDITKEALVLSMPAHRALTELDALAREYDELNRKYHKK